MAGQSLSFSQAVALPPTDRDDASQSPVNVSAPYEGPLHGPFCPSIKYSGVMVQQDQQSMELCILALCRQVSSTAKVLVLALQTAQCLAKAG